MSVRTFSRVVFIFLIGCWVVCAASQKDPLYKVPAEKRARLGDRLRDYVKENKNRDWERLYDLVSDTGRGKVDRAHFIQLMNVGHGRDFANYPDLLEFHADRTEANDTQFDIYGCGKAAREGEDYNGIALIHAVFEHDNWFFAGWTFVGGDCDQLLDKEWKPPAPMKWTQPMDELRGVR